MTWPDWAQNDSDPLYFLGTGVGKEPERKETPPEISPLSLKEEHDPVVQADAIDPKQPGKGIFGLNIDYYFDERLDSDDRLDRLERAVSAMHRDIATLLPLLKEKGPNLKLTQAAEPAPPTLAQPQTTQPLYQPYPSLPPAQAPQPQPQTNTYAPVSLLATAPTPQIPAPPQPQAYTPALSPMPGSAPRYMLDNPNPAPPPPPQTVLTQKATPVTNMGYPEYQPAMAQPMASAPTPEDYARNGLPPPAPDLSSSAQKLDPGPRHLNVTNATVSGIRIGDQGDRMRVVFDVTAQTPYTVSLDNDEKLLIVQLPNAKWKTPAAYESFKKNPVFQSYRVEPYNNGQGNLFALQLNKPTRIAYEKVFDALSGGGKRIVIDLMK